MIGSYIGRLLARPAALLPLVLSGCTLLGRLPYDPMEAPPMPEGRRIKPTVGWLTTERAEVSSTPEGSLSIDIVHLAGRTLLQEVRHVTSDGQSWGDSVLLDRSTLRPYATWRWTPAGEYMTRFNHREVERIFRPLHGSPSRSIETLDVEPYSALGLDLLVSALPLQEGYRGLLPVAVDTATRGWEWLHIFVPRTLTLQERPDQPSHEFWIVDCDIGKSRTRLWITTDGRSVRRIERLGPDNEVLAMVRRTLLALPEAPVRPGP